MPVDFVDEPPRLLAPLRAAVGDERVQGRHQPRRLPQQGDHRVAAVPAQRRQQRRAVVLADRDADAPRSRRAA